jgi:hypothetical protein
MNVIIYAIRNRIDNKMYIGSTTNWEERQKSHKKTIRGKLILPSKLYEAAKGLTIKDFEFLIIEENIPIEDIFIKEEYWIVFYDSINKGYNVTLPSKSNNTYEGLLKRKAFCILAPLTNIKCMSKEEWVKRRKENVNFKTSDLDIKKIRDYSITYKSVYELDSSYNIIDTIDSISHLFKLLNLKENRVNSTLTYNGSKPFKFRKINNRIFIKKEDYIFPLLKEKEVVFKEPYIQPTKSITLIKNGEEMFFDSHTKASIFLNINKSKLYNLIKGYRNKGQGVIVNVTNIKGWAIKSSTVFCTTK